MISPFAAGGSTDTLARVIGQRMTETWGQPVIVENRPGAGGQIAADLLAKAPPDGYLLLLTSVSAHAIGPAMSSKLPYDPIRDFAPVSQVNSWYGVLAPAATPPDIVNKAGAEISRIVKLPQVRERLGHEGLEAAGTTPQEFAAYIKAEVAKWAKVVRTAGIKVE